MTDKPPDIAPTPDDLAERCYPLNVDSPHVAALKDTSERVRFFLVDLSGLDVQRIEALLPIVIREMARRTLVPVFVTDLLDYRVFREAGVIFEALPPVTDNAVLMPERDWARRQKDVKSLIREKWKPAGEVALDRSGVPEFNLDAGPVTT